MKKMGGGGEEASKSQVSQTQRSLDHCVRGKVQPVLLAWCTKMYNATLCRWFEVLQKQARSDGLWAAKHTTVNSVSDKR